MDTSSKDHAAPGRATATRRAPLTLHVCFQRLRARPWLLRTWHIGWAALLAWGAFAFLAAPASIAIYAQAAFFVLLFPWTLLPVFAALGRNRCETD